MTAIVAPYTVHGDMAKGYAVARDSAGNFLACGKQRSDGVFILVRSTGKAFHEMYPPDEATARLWLETAAREATR